MLKNLIKFLLLLVLLINPSISYASTTVYTTNLLYGSNDGDGDDNINSRFVFLANSLSAAPGANQFRVTYFPGDNSPAATAFYTSTWGGRGTGGGAYVFNGNQAQALFDPPYSGSIGSSSADLTATSTSAGTIAGTVLTVAGGSGWGVGKIVSGSGVTPGSTIIPGGTGTGGAGTYNLDRSSTVTVAVGMSGVLPIVSDWATFAGGETFDNTQDFIISNHINASSNGGTTGFVNSGLINATVYFDGGTTGDNAGVTSPPQSFTSLPNSNNGILLLEMRTAAGASTVSRRALTGIGQ